MYRAIAVVNAFVAAGWQVTVVTTTEQFFEDEIGSVDRSLFDFVPLDVRVVRVPFFPSDPAACEIRDMSRFRANFPKVWSLYRRKASSLRSTISSMRGREQGRLLLEDYYVRWIEPTVEALRSEHSQRPIDHILATGSPYSSLEAARVAGRLFDIPYSLDYRDPWTIELRNEGPASLPSATLAAEAVIVRDSAACFHVNEAIASAYAELYPESAASQHVVINGFDSSSISVVPSPNPDGPITFGMLGTANASWPLEIIFEGWARVRDDLPENSELVLAGHLGYFARNEAALRDDLPGKNSGFRYLGPVEKAAVAEFYGAIDVVIVPAWGRGMVTTGKVYEAAALGIPIVCVQGDDGGARAILEDHPLAFGAGHSADEVEAAFRRAADAVRSLTEERILSVRQQMKHFERSEAMHTMIKVISEQCSVAVDV